MIELIKITKNNKGTQVVSAKELYINLDYNQSHWKRWYVKNIVKNDFAIENVDYQTFDIMANGNPTKDFALTLDFAKRLSMLARTEPGEKARNYFIAVEKLQSQVKLPNKKELALMVVAAEDKIESQKKQLQAQAPKVEFVNRVLNADELVDIGQASKLLGLKFGRNTLFKKLREKGVFFKNRNEPKQNYISIGYFKVKEVLIERENHKDIVSIKVLVTQKGLLWLSKMFGVVLEKKQLAFLN